MLVNPQPISFEEFLEVDKNAEERLEYINGKVYSHAAPTIAHQRIVGRLFTELSIFFRGKQCEPFVSPIDVILQNENDKHKVQPDIVVLCDKEGLTKNNYIGVPTLVIEVLSPATASKDFIEKMNIYMRFGVKEYWIVCKYENSVR